MLDIQWYHTEVKEQNKLFQSINLPSAQASDSSSHHAGNLFRLPLKKAKMSEDYLNTCKEVLESDTAGLTKHEYCTSYDLI
jgi:hypothetical protein